MSRIRHLARLACFLLLGLALSYAEHLLPLDFGIPGVKLGLPNLLIIVLLYEYGLRDAALVNLARILLTGLLFGNLYGAIYGLCGSVLAMLGMVSVMRLPRVSPIGVGIAGGLLHNAGQLAAAMLLTSPYLYAYLPVLLFSGTLAGLLTGLGAGLMRERLPRTLKDFS